MLLNFVASHSALAFTRARRAEQQMRLVCTALFLRISSTCERASGGPAGGRALMSKCVLGKKKSQAHLFSAHAASFFCASHTFWYSYSASVFLFLSHRVLIRANRRTEHCTLSVQTAGSYAQVGRRARGNGWPVIGVSRRITPT